MRGCGVLERWRSVRLGTNSLTPSLKAFSGFADIAGSGASSVTARAVITCGSTERSGTRGMPSAALARAAAEVAEGFGDFRLLARADDDTAKALPRAGMSPGWWRCCLGSAEAPRTPRRSRSLGGDTRPEGEVRRDLGERPRPSTPLPRSVELLPPSADLRRGVGDSREMKGDDGSERDAARFVESAMLERRGRERPRSRVVGRRSAGDATRREAGTCSSECSGCSLTGAERADTGVELETREVLGETGEADASQNDVEAVSSTSALVACLAVDVAARGGTITSPSLGVVSSPRGKRGVATSPALLPPGKVLPALELSEAEPVLVVSDVAATSCEG
mmetsp:Transcript_18826/g.44093  ORF Transcript_18826/g.44093 Transcript_18826/m.44093 type:complete len:336 (-) Transcript_18826:5491-6498(-)